MKTKTMGGILIFSIMLQLSLFSPVSCLPSPVYCLLSPDSCLLPPVSRLLSPVSTHAGELLPASGVTAQVFFSPKGGAQQAVIAAIDGATKEVLVQAYGFTSGPIALALINAHKRGVRVELLMDKGEASDRGSVVPALLKAGIRVWIDGGGGLQHSKIMLIDGHKIITGSYNWTLNAEQSNEENLLIIDGFDRLYADYSNNRMSSMKHATELPQTTNPP